MLKLKNMLFIIFNVTYFLKYVHHLIEEVVELKNMHDNKILLNNHCNNYPNINLIKLN